MAAVLGSIIAVLGTLAGTTAGYLFQRRIADRSEAIAREDRLWRERLVACSAFAGAVMDLRRAQYDLWHRSHEFDTYEFRQADPADARSETYRLRSGAWSAFYRFMLTTDDTGLVNMGWTAVEEAAHVAKATTEEELRERGEGARARIDGFVAAAARHLNGSATPVSAPTSPES